MDRKLSDEQIDRIAKKLLQDFALSDEATGEIADAPLLWRNVRKGIEAEKARREKSRFAWFRPQILAFGALAILMGGVLALSVLNFANDSDSSAALEKAVENPSQIAQSSENSTAVLPAEDFKTPENPPQSPAKISSKNNPPRREFVAKNRESENSVRQLSRRSKAEISAPETAVEEKAVAETKTDFIALSYAASTESGQIVRVKVPSSMMVSLGVKTEVKDGSELVSAEVVIGDDGMARAIRFIR